MVKIWVSIIVDKRGEKNDERRSIFRRGRRDDRGPVRKHGKIRRVSVRLTRRMHYNYTYEPINEGETRNLTFSTGNSIGGRSLK